MGQGHAEIFSMEFGKKPSITDRTFCTRRVRQMVYVACMGFGEET
jgi:hypothetical protein